MDSILFVTSTNLATNPRCLKEIQLAVGEGIRVMVMACNLGGWSEENERIIHHSLEGKAEIKYVDITRADKINWLLGTLVEKVCFFLYRTFNLNTLIIASYAFSKSSFFLFQRLNKTHWRPSLVIAHNPAAFYPAYKFAKKMNVPFAMDVEDYHPKEKQPLLKKKLIKEIMQRLLPKVIYSSYAAPLILEQTKKEIPCVNSDSSYVLNNVFWNHEFISPLVTENAELKFVWFSQNIDYGRGLEKLLKAFDKLSKPFTLTLIGNVRNHFFQHELKHRNYIILLETLPQPRLHQLLAHYDIGLAVEDEQTDVNRRICLTNKIWAYFQAGLYIMATNTPAQIDFISQFPSHGTLAGNSVDKYLETVRSINANWHQLNQSKYERFVKAAAYSWDSESKKLLSIWRTIKS